MWSRPFRFGKPLRIACALLAVAAGPATMRTADTAERIVVIANAGVTEDGLPLASLRATYSMRVRLWPDGTPVRVFVLPDRDPLHAAFSQQVLHIYPYVLRDTWDRMVFTGTGQPPTQVTSQQEMLQRISETPGAIGYIEQGRIPNERIKILQVQ
jgi:hypothetical protein